MFITLKITVQQFPYSIKMAIDLKKISKKKNIPSASSGSSKDSVLNFLNKDIELFGKLNDKKKQRFYKELSLLFASGVDIKSAFELLIEGQKGKKEIELFTDIKNFIINGGSLSKALSKIAKFSLYETVSIKIGEETGQLDKVLNELAAYYVRRIKNKRQIVSAISYPLFIMAIAIGAMIFMLNFVVPLFKDLFSQFGQELPWITKITIQVSETIGDWSGFIFLTICLVTVVLILLRNNKTYRKITSSIVLRIPVMGELFQKIFLARFAQAMGMLTSANTPLVQSIGLTQKMVGFYPIEHSLDIIRQDILSGLPLAMAMSKFSIYPKQTVTLIKVAEEVNQLDTMFIDISNQLNEDIEYQSKVLSGLLEPLLIVLVGALIAIVLIAMYLPMFNMGSILS